MSIKGIVNTIETVSMSHALVQSFYAGFAWDSSVQNISYPSVFVETIASTIEDKEISHKFNIIISDRLMKGLNNEISSISDMLEIGLDIRTKLKDALANDFNNAAIQDTLSYIPFTAGSNDDTAGVMLDITIVEVDLKDRCNFPLK